MPELTGSPRISFELFQAIDSELSTQLAFLRYDNLVTVEELKNALVTGVTEGFDITQTQIYERFVDLIETQDQGQNNGRIDSREEKELLQSTLDDLLSNQYIANGDFLGFQEIRNIELHLMQISPIYENGTGQIENFGYSTSREGMGYSKFLELSANGMFAENLISLVATDPAFRDSTLMQALINYLDSDDNALFPNDPNDLNFLTPTATNAEILAALPIIRENASSYEIWQKFERRIIDQMQGS